VELMPTKNSRIVADGFWRLRRGQKAMKQKSARDKSAAETEKARSGENSEICQPLAEDARQREKMVNHKPSAGALW